MTDYLKISYNGKDKPYTEYPRKLIYYLADSFKIQKGMSLLEPGCGRGEHLRVFKELGLNVCGLDISPESPLMAKDLDITVHNLESNRLPYPDNNFDVIYSKSFLEHIKDPYKFLLECYRVLKPGGIIISLVPDWESQYKKFYDDYTHVSPFTKISLRDIKLSTGFKDVDVYKFRQLPVVWRYPVINYLCSAISPFIPVRTTNSFLRWTRELMLIGIGVKSK
jgi:SAM-dependent methyltransferase